MIDKLGKEVKTYIEMQHSIKAMEDNNLWDDSDAFQHEQWVRLSFVEGLLDEKDREIQKEAVFISHIQSHLKPNQRVICKICGASVEEIYKVHGKRACAEK